VVWVWYLRDLCFERLHFDYNILTWKSTTLIMLCFCRALKFFYLSTFAHDVFTIFVLAKVCRFKCVLYGVCADLLLVKTQLFFIYFELCVLWIGFNWTDWRRRCWPTFINQLSLYICILFIAYLLFDNLLDVSNVTIALAVCNQWSLRCLLVT